MLEVKHPTPKDSDLAQIAADIEGLRAEFTDKLSRLVAIPSVSMQPSDTTMYAGVPLLPVLTCARRAWMRGSSPPRACPSCGVS